MLAAEIGSAPRVAEEPLAPNAVAGFLRGAGMAGRLIGDFDWASTDLGPIVNWPHSLKVTVGTIVHSSVPMVLLWGAHGYMIYNDSYSEFAGARHPELLGSRVREGWPEVADFNDNVMRVCLAGGTLAYADQELTLYRHGLPEQVWMNLNYSPVLDESGAPAGVLAIVVETTQRVLAERRNAAERQRLAQMFDQGPSFMALLGGPAHRFEIVNASYQRLIGERDVLGKTVEEALPDAVAQGYLGLLDDVFTTGKPFASTGAKFNVQAVAGGPVEERFVDFIYQPIADESGAVTGIFVGGVDVTPRAKAETALAELNMTLEQRIAERTQQLLSREALLRTFFDHSSEYHAVFIADDNDQFRYEEINPATERLYQLPRDMVIGRTTNDIHGPDAAIILNNNLMACLYTGRPHRYRRREGDTVIEAVATPVPYHVGSTSRILVSAHDVTDKAAQEVALLAANRRLEEMASTDALTGLPNRLRLTDRLAEAVRQCGTPEQGVALLYIDLDRFKPVNDLLGHAIGDTLLIEVARRLESCLSGRDTLARLGGDEFAIVLPFTGETRALDVAEHIVLAMAEPFDLQSHQIEVGASVGIAQYPKDALSDQALLRRADIAMYRAKEEGGGFKLFEHRMDAELNDRRTMEQDLRHAVRRSELELHYQPIFDCITGELFAFEALLRWNHPTRGQISPNIFIPVAEETGMIVPIGRWVLQTACREAASWTRPLRIAVNISPLQFRQPNLPEEVSAIVAATGMAPDRLDLEVTEGVLIEDPERAMAIITALKAQGIHISLDDFGTGYSSLIYLHRFPFDTIKIDRAFIADLSTEPQARAIVEAVIFLAQGLHLAIVAEGVETQQQLAILHSLSCTFVQGFRMGRPVPATMLPELLCG